MEGKKKRGERNEGIKRKMKESRERTVKIKNTKNDIKERKITGKQRNGKGRRKEKNTINI